MKNAHSRETEVDRSRFCWCCHFGRFSEFYFEALMKNKLFRSCLIILVDKLDFVHAGFELFSSVERYCEYEIRISRILFKMNIFRSERIIYAFHLEKSSIVSQ